MTALLSAVGSVVTTVFSMVATVATTIAGTVTSGSGDAAVTTLKSPILVLFCVAVPLCGLGVGMFKRLLSARG
mgnify:FL=1